MRWASRASRLVKNGDDEVWVKPLQGGGRAIVLFNRSKETHKIGVTWEALGYPATLELRVRDLWSHKDLPKTHGSFAADVPPHGVVMIRVEA